MVNNFSKIDTADTISPEKEFSNIKTPKFNKVKIQKVNEKAYLIRSRKQLSPSNTQSQTTQPKSRYSKNITKK